MLTDDPDTPGSNRWEINIALAAENLQSEQARSFPLVDLNYGLGETIQLKYETAWELIRPAGQGWTSGLGNSLIGMKWRFVDGGDSGLKLSVYPQYEFENGTQSVERGIVEPGPNFFLPIEVSRSFGRIGLVGELGYHVLHTEEDEWVYGVLAGFAASEQLELLAEIHGSTTKELNNWDPVINFGLRRRLGSRFKLLASMGTGIGNEPDRTHFIAYLGVQLLLGKERE